MSSSIRLRRLKVKEHFHNTSTETVHVLRSVGVPADLVEPQHHLVGFSNGWRLIIGNELFDTLFEDKDEPGAST